MNRYISLAGVAVVTLVGCSTADQTKVTNALATPAGQLFCQVAAGAGPLVVAAIDKRLSGSTYGPIAVLATDKSVAYVNATCAAAGGVPVSPPANPDAAPKVLVTPPTGS